MMEVGTEIEGFRITGVLGHGGMGIVYEAEDVALGRTVALKTIAPNYARDEHFLRRFQAEARALARINEPHIVQVHALRHTDTGVFIVMECVDGGTLGDLIAQGPVPVPKAVPLIRQMLQAFGHAHDLGVIHRDIKPGNIMLTRDGVVKVTDFGLARVQQSQSEATVTSVAAGTLYYMPPEVVKGSASIDHRADLFALGMTIYEMLAGRLPFERNLGEFETMRIIVEEAFPPPSKFNAAIPAELSRIVLKSIEKNPDRRYQHARDMLADIEAFAGRPANDDATVVLDRTPFSGSDSKRRRIFVASGIVAAIVLLVVAGVWAFRDPEERIETVEPDPVSVEPATLDLVTTPPGASALIDGRSVGITPLAAEVEPDSQGVRLRVEREGYEPLDTLVFPVEGQTLALALTLREIDDEVTTTTTDETQPPALGRLIVTLVGDGVARVGGRAYEGDARVSLPPGRHTLQCGEPPFDLTTRVDVRTSADSRVTCYFEARITLNTQMDDGGLAPSASIWIDGQDTGLVTPREIVRGPGRYTITVRKFGFDVLNQEEVVIRPTLEPQAPRRIVFSLRQTT